MQFGLWRRPRVVAGRVYVIPGLGTLRVTAVEKIDLSRITPWEAEASGAEDVAQLREWLKEEKPDADVEEGMCYRVRFRFLGPETKGGTAAAEGEGDVEAAEGGDHEGEGEESEAGNGEAGEDEGGEGEDEEGPVRTAKAGRKPDSGKAAAAEPFASKVLPKAIPPDLMEWVAKTPWHRDYLTALASGIWRNADEMGDELATDSPTIRRRLGDLRKRGLVNSHRHHGYRITPEGQGALATMVEHGSSSGETMAGWLEAKKERSDVTGVLGDGGWHNADEVARALGLSVVSVQRRVAALRDRGLVESHRRRGYRLTEKGRAATGAPTPSGTAGPAGAPAPEEGPSGRPDSSVAPPQPLTPVAPAPPEVSPPPAAAPPTPPAPLATSEPPLSASLLEWLEAKPYRKELLLAIRPGKYVPSGELSTTLSTSVTALHGRLKTLKEHDLVDAAPRLGYTLTALGARASTVMRALAAKGRNEPVGAESFLRAEPVGWTPGTRPEAAPEAPAPRAARQPGQIRLAQSGECGFCRATAKSGPRPGWVRTMQTHLEFSTDPAAKGESTPCSRGVFEDASWFLTVDRDPLAEGHCKLVCKEHVADLMELAEWAGRDTRMAAVRDTMARDLMLASEVIYAIDPRIVEVSVLTGVDHGVHLCFDLVPRYRMDLPGIRPLASARSHYDDLSLARKRRLWEVRREHMQEIAAALRGAATRVIRARAVPGVVVSEP
jgi:Mn-dependent DtxR family transcriptional regulator/diadenosine tetraphosphate (Ap4A) HIT family hydrolase